MDALELTKNTLLVLHLVGHASLLGGFLTQVRAMRQGTARIVPSMMHGVWTALATGLLLVGLAEYRVAMGADFDVNHMKIGVKSLVVLIIMFLLYRERKKNTVKAGPFGAIGGLTLGNIVLAVFW